MTVQGGDRDKNGKFVPGNAFKQPNITVANAVAKQQLSTVSRKQNTLDAIRDAFIEGESIWTHGVQRAAAVLVSIIHEEKANDRDKIRAFRELTKHLTSEMGVTVKDGTGREIHTGTVEEFDQIIDKIDRMRGGVLCVKCGETVNG